MMNVEDTKKVVVVGGGITGLSAAFYMQKEAKEKGYPLDVLLVESTHRLGGKIQTVRKDGFIIERGPDSFLERKKSMGELAQDVGIADQLVNNSTGQSFVLLEDRLHPIPKGSVMGIPTDLNQFFSSGLFSLSGKVRALEDLVLPRSNVKGDQSLGQFFRRRLGNEVVENLMEPLLSGIYAGDLDKLSLQSTYPQFYETEQKHRSLILGTRKNTAKRAAAPSPSGKGKGQFQTLRNGLESLVEAIETKLAPGSVLKGVKVEGIEKEEGKVTLHFNNGQTVIADAVIFATSHHVVRELFEPFGLLSGLKAMPSATVATVAMAFPAEKVKQEDDGTGFVVSRNSDFAITACTWTHRKWPTTTPEGKVLLRSYVGREGDEAIVDLSDKELEKIVLDDLRKIIDIDGDPEFTIVSRWKNSMHQYTVGHKQRIEKSFREVEQAFPMVKLAGASYEGIGLPDCVNSGKKAVREVLDDLFK